MHESKVLQSLDVSLPQSQSKINHHWLLWCKNLLEKPRAKGSVTSSTSRSTLFQKKKKKIAKYSVLTKSRHVPEESLYSCTTASYDMCVSLPFTWSLTSDLFQTLLDGFRFFQILSPSLSLSARKMAFEKIRVTNPIVEMDGERRFQPLFFPLIPIFFLLIPLSSCFSHVRIVNGIFSNSSSLFCAFAIIKIKNPNRGFLL